MLWLPEENDKGDIQYLGYYLVPRRKLPRLC
jgi:hypothetical protein